MESKNMLTQVKQTTVYDANISLATDFTSLKQYSFSLNDIIASSITTWSNNFDLDGNGAAENTSWFVNDTYVYNKDFSYVDFGSNDWTYTAEAFKDASSIFPWQMTSNITRYDPYSHPIEESHRDGTYTSSQYAHGEAVPIAIVANAKRGAPGTVGNEASYIGFESHQDANDLHENDYWSLHGSYNLWSALNDAHTGVYSRQIPAGNPIYGPTRDFLPSNQERKYKLTCWVKTEAGFGANKGYLVLHSKQNADLPNSTYPNVAGAYIAVTFGDTGGQWQYVEAILDLKKVRADGIAQNLMPSTEQLRLRCFPYNTDTGHYLLVDAIRFQPVNAMMSTFTYDPLTLQVTSITDANNVTTYYDYDDLGRLIRVWDQDKRLLKKHSYYFDLVNK
jgi:YD repeat-containing protein